MRTGRTRKKDGYIESQEDDKNEAIAAMEDRDITIQEEYAIDDLELDGILDIQDDDGETQEATAALSDTSEVIDIQEAELEEILGIQEDDDKRPDPKPRKHPELWQSYLWWNELMQILKAHKLRLSSIEKRKSNLKQDFEEERIAILTPMEAHARAHMVAWGEEVGPIWDWLIGFKGIGPHTAAKLLALFDDVGKFATISKFWRFAGWAVIDGKIDHCVSGQTSPYNRRLKSECYILGNNMIKHQTPEYVPVYYAEKERIRRMHPVKEPATSGPWPYLYTDSHVHRMARRKMVKRFLSHFWVKWCEYDGLPVSEPYVQAILGHTHIVPPPEHDK